MHKKKQKVKAAQSAHSVEIDRVRLDKWLWAARIYKTRGLAKHSIDGGKVHCEGIRAKASKEIAVGATLAFRQGWDEKTVVVTALSEQRRGAEEASKLYQETPQSIEKRLLIAEQKRAQSPISNKLAGKPNKKNRRLITRFKHRD